MKSNNLIDITTDNYYINPYKFTKQHIDIENILLSETNENENLNLIIKTLTSIIMNNDIQDYNNDNILDKNNNLKNIISNTKSNNFDKFIIFKLIANNKIDKLKNILKYNNNIDLNIKDNDGDTALHIAIFLSNYNACEILIKNKVDIFVKDKWGQIAIHRICFCISDKNSIKIIDLIAKIKTTNNKNVFNEIDKFNNTPLHLVLKYILKNKIYFDKNILLILNKLMTLTDIHIKNNDNISCYDLINKLKLIE